MTQTENAVDRVLREAQERRALIESQQREAPTPPSVRALCLEEALYTEIQLNPGRDANYIHGLKFGDLYFDAYCVHCEKSSTFRAVPDRTPDDVVHAKRFAAMNEYSKKELKRLNFERGQFAIHLACSRSEHHIYSYFFTLNQSAVLTKIGQTPSLEDVAGADIDRYRKILGSDYGELRRATGLFAHGIGIGSFVYLRRIFENLVEQARSAADPTGEREAEFLGMRMAERITALAAHLPEAVVAYKETYSILSKGLHELTDAECKRHFPVIRAAIIIMLEQRYEAAEKEKAMASLERAVRAIHSETKKPLPG